MKIKNLSITLPESMLALVDRASKQEHRTRSEFVHEAIRSYMKKTFPVSLTSPEETRALKRDRIEYASGKFVTLETTLNEMDRPRR